MPGSNYVLLFKKRSMNYTATSVSGIHNTFNFKVVL